MSEKVRPEVLISRLTSPNESWRVDAEARLISLGELSVPALIGAMKHAAAHALARIGNPSAIPALITALEDAENNAAGAIAAEKALVLWGEAVRGALLEASLRGPAQIRPRALRALGKIGGGDLEQPLRSLLRDPIPAVRTQAAAALAQIGAAQAVELIAPLLEDRDKWVRYGVAEALVQAGSPRGQAVLEQAKKDPEEEGTYLRFWAEERLDQIEELKRTGRAIP